MQAPAQYATAPVAGAVAFAVLSNSDLPGNLEPMDAELQGELPPVVFTAAVTDAVGIAANDPPNVGFVQKQADWPQWDKAIKKELQQNERVGTWELVKVPPNVNTIGSRFVLHYKRDAAGAVISYKARLVAQGFLQAEGIDYNETFAPTAKLSAICIIAAIAARNNWGLEQTNVDGAYLNAILKETIYMRQPKNYEGKNNMSVC